MVWGQVKQYPPTIILLMGGVLSPVADDLPIVMA